jgi:hypothetical protein
MHHPTVRYDKLRNTTQNTVNMTHIAHLRQECHNSKFGISELFVEKETFADALLTGIVS